MSRDKAEQVAESLLKPSADRLAERKARLEHWKRSNDRPFASLVPSAAAACGTAWAILFLQVHPLVAIVFGASLGWSISSYVNLKKTKR